MVRGLETVEQNQSKIFAIKDKDWAYEFAKQLKCIEEGGYFVSHVKAARSYIVGDNLLKEKMLNDQDKFANQRNNNWFPKLDKYLNENPNNILVAVGLAHLFGEAGIIPHYYKDGWKVEQATISGDFF